MDSTFRTDYKTSTSQGIGSVPAAVAASVKAFEQGNDVIHKTVLSLVDMPLVAANTTGVSFGGTKVYDFPAGRIYLLGSVLRGLTVGLGSDDNNTPITGAMGGDISIGSTAPTDGTLTGTDVDILPSTSIDPISGGISFATLAAAAFFANQATALDAFLNMLIDDADVADGASDELLINGEIILHWLNLGAE